MGRSSASIPQTWVVPYETGCRWFQWENDGSWSSWWFNSQVASPRRTSLPAKMRGLFQDRLLKTFANSSSYQLGVKNSQQILISKVSTSFQHGFNCKNSAHLGRASHKLPWRHGYYGPALMTRAQLREVDPPTPSNTLDMLCTFEKCFMKQFMNLDVL